MKMKLLIIMSMLSALVWSAQAGNLVDYGFDQTNLVVDAVGANLTAGDLVKSAGNVVDTDAKANPYGIPHWKNFGTAAALSFSLAPDSGYGVSCTNLAFAVQIDSNTGDKERKLEITSSATGTNVLHTLYNYAAWVAAGSNPADDKLPNTNAWEDRNIDLSGFAALQNVSGSITFTFTISDVSTGTPVNGNMRMDDIGVDGTVAEYTPTDILADYGFDQTNGVADAAALNLTAGNLTWTTGSIPTSDGKISLDGLPQWKKYGTEATLDFTLSPDEGYGISCTNLSFEIQMDSSATIQRKMEVTSSATGTNILFEIYNAQYASDLGIPSSSPSYLTTDFEVRSIDLSVWNTLQDVTSDLTFYFTFSGPGADNGNLRMDAFLLNGGVAVSTNTIPALLGYEMGTNTPHVVDASVQATVLNVDTNAGDTVVSVVFDKTLEPDPTPDGTQPFLQVYSTNSRVVVTVEPDPSYEVNLSELAFEMQIQNGGRWVELTSSATGTNVLWAVKTGTSTADAQLVSTGFNSYSIDLSGIPELQGVTDATTFEFEYFTDSGDADQNARNWRFDNLYVYGGNAVIPPSSIEEFGIGITDGSNVVLSWQGNPAGTYTIQRKLDLVYDTVWSNVVENIPGVSGIMSVTNEATEDQAYFRTILVD